eukprot:2269861-Pyramimonas_sp.AAC.1
MLAWPQRSQLASGRARRTASRRALSRTEAGERNVRACCQPTVLSFGCDASVTLRCSGERDVQITRALTACEGLRAHVTPRSPSRARVRII